MAQDAGEPVSPPQDRTLKVLEKPRDPPRHYYLEHTRVDYIISPNGDVDTNLLINAPYDDLVTRLKVMKKIRVEQIPGDVLIRVVNDIASQVQKEAGKPHLSNEEFTRIHHSQDAITNLLTNYRHNPSVPFPSQALRKIKDLYIVNPQQNIGVWEMQYIEQSNVAKLIVLDERNGEMGNERLGIKEEVAGEILTELRSLPLDYPALVERQSVYPDNTERRTLAYTLACGKAATREIMYQFLQEQDQIPIGFLQVFGNALGFGIMRSYINKYVKSYPDQRDKFEDLSKRVGLDKGETIFFDLKEVYQAATESFENYQPYLDLQETDMAVLKSHLPKDGVILDLGFGKGRHLIPLLKAGYPVEGAEDDERSFASVLAQQPEAVLKIGSVHNLPYEDHSLDAVYLLGRTLTHLTSTYEAIAVFRELRRVLKDGGIIIFDLPDLRTEEMREYSNERLNFLSDKLRIWNKEAGTIHDSPDGKHYFDRFVLSYVYQVAMIAGLDAKVIEEASYKGASSKEAKNEYWVATIHPRGPIDTQVEELQPLKHLTSSGDKGLDLDRY